MLYNISWISQNDSRNPCLLFVEFPTHGWMWICVYRHIPPSTTYSVLKYLHLAIDRSEHPNFADVTKQTPWFVLFHWKLFIWNNDRHLPVIINIAPIHLIVEPSHQYQSIRNDLGVPRKLTIHMSTITIWAIIIATNVLCNSTKTRISSCPISCWLLAFSYHWTSIMSCDLLPNREYLIWKTAMHPV